MHSDPNSDSQVIRIRFKNLRDEIDESSVQVISDCENDIMNEIVVKGIPEVQKVYYKKI